MEKINETKDGNPWVQYLLSIGTGFLGFIGLFIWNASMEIKPVEARLSLAEAKIEKLEKMQDDVSKTREDVSVLRNDVGWIKDRMKEK